jgi:hypothetical protein
MFESKLAEYAGNIKEMDTRDNLKLYHYTECNDESPEFVKECRGVVWDGEKIVMKTFGYSPEYVFESDNVEHVHKLQQVLGDIGKCKFFVSEEGSLVRLFNYNSQWILSTHKKLDAYNSKWSSNENFGEIFEKSLYNEYVGNTKFAEFVGTGLSKPKTVFEFLTKKLDTERSYLFFLKNTIFNRIVCKATDDYQLYLAGSFNREGEDFTVSHELPISISQELYFDNYVDIIKYSELCDYEKCQGVLIVRDGKTLVKLLNQRYYDYFNIRGNEPNITFRYLQLRNEADKIEMFMDLYPEHEKLFETCEMNLDEISRRIHNCYINRFVKKEYSVVPPDQYQIIKECHSWHLSDRDNNKVSLSKVKNVLDNYPVKHVYKILKNYMNGNK